MDADLCKLMLVYPPASEDALTGLLESFDPPLPGYTSWAASGHGLGFDSASHAERVKGQVSRRVLVMIIAHHRAAEVLERIRQDLPVPHLVYWTEPVLAAGRLI